MTSVVSEPATSSTTSFAPTGRIVVGVDGSDPSLAALRWAQHLATLSSTTVLVVAVWEPATAFGLVGAGWGAVPPDWDIEGATRLALEESVVAALGDDAHGVETRVEQGSPAQVLIELSADAQMLVVGSRGHGGFASLLLGSVSGACVEHAACPVLVVRETAAEPGPTGG
ncbi:MAG: universal stress protein [Terracoccus sp.]